MCKDYGFIKKNSSEYVITRPDTPKPWINYIGNEKYCVRFSQTGGGDSFHRFPRVNMVTFGQYDDSPEWFSDQPGRWIYIKDNQNGRFWTTNWQPVKADYESYKCSHGINYSKIESKTNGILSSLRIFVPLNQIFEIWTVEVKNEHSEKADLDVFPFVHWFLIDNIMKFGFASDNHARYDKTENLIYTWLKRIPRPEQNYAAFMASDFIPDDYELSRRDFLGNYGTFDSPKMLVENKTHKTDFVDYEPMVGVLQKSIVLKPSESFKFNILVGSVDGKQQAIELKRKYLDSALIEMEFEKLQKHWNDKLSTTVIETPDSELNWRVNYWMKNQVYHRSLWAGPGGDKGFRDQCQDAENLISFDCQHAKKIIKEAMINLYYDGRSPRGWPQEPGGNFNKDDYRDCPIWLVYSLCEYVKETGDQDFLNETLPYLDKGQGSVYEHITTILDFYWNDRGVNGLNHIGRGDWNDSLNEVGIKGKGESVWLSMAVVRAFKEFARLAEYIGENAKAKEAQEKVSQISNIINEVAWDGRWYTRAINDYGNVIGSSKCKEGKIFLLPQAWAMLAGISSSEQNSKMIEAIEEMLLIEYGPMVLAPEFTEYQKGVGKISNRPGFSEDGSVYNHAAAFLMAGYCAIGEGDRAYDIYKRINPLNPANPLDKNWSEPFAYSNFYMGPQTRTPGKTLYGWLTGTAGWMLKNCIERLCGVQADYEGLQIKPVLPSAWNQIKINRQFRGTHFNISIMKSENKFIKVNGEEVTLPIKPTTDLVNIELGI